MFQFELTLDEANFILSVLGQQEYNKVAGLIAKINQQAQPQIPRVQKEIEEANAARQEAEAKAKAAEEKAE